VRRRAARRTRDPRRPRPARPRAPRAAAVWEPARSAWRALRDFLAAVEAHALFSHAAAVAFYMFFSIPPAVLAIVALVGLLPLERLLSLSANEVLEWTENGLAVVLPRDSAAGMCDVLALRLRPLMERMQEMSGLELVTRIREFLDRALPADAAEAIGGIAEDILGHPRPALLTVSFVGVLWAAGASTRAAMRAMNVIYEVRKRGFLERNLISLALTAGILLGLTLSLSILPVGNALAVEVVERLGLPSEVLTLWSLLGWVVGLGLLLLIVLALHRFGPNAAHDLGTVLPGSALTVGLWVVLSLALRVWTERGWDEYNATYGALAGVIVLLVWCYLAALALLVGAELNVLLLFHRGRWLDAVGERVLPFARRLLHLREPPGTKKPGS